MQQKGRQNSKPKQMEKNEKGEIGRKREREKEREVPIKREGREAIVVP